MSKTLVIGTIVVVVGLFALGGFLLWQDLQPRTEWPPENVIQLPESETFAYVNRLTILASGQDVEAIVKEFGGEITLSIPETDTYEARFPVSTLEELDEIKNQLSERGVQAVYSYMMQPPDCSKGPC